MMKYLIPSILLIISIIYLINYIIIKYRFNHGIKYSGVIKDYMKYKRYRIYDVKLSNKECINIMSPKFFIINSNIIVSKYKNRYYNNVNLSDLIIKIFTFTLIACILFIYIAIKYNL